MAHYTSYNAIIYILNSGLHVDNIYIEFGTLHVYSNTLFVWESTVAMPNFVACGLPRLATNQACIQSGGLYLQGWTTFVLLFSALNSKWLSEARTMTFVHFSMEIRACLEKFSHWLLKKLYQISEHRWNFHCTIVNCWRISRKNGYLAQRINHCVLNLPRTSLALFNFVFLTLWLQTFVPPEIVSNNLKYN